MESNSKSIELNEYTDTSIYMSNNKILGVLTVKELLLATILGIMGGFISQLIPFSEVMKIIYPFYGGQQLMSGHHLIWMSIAYGMTRKKPSIMMTAFMKGIIESILGDNWGFLILILNLFEGFSLACGFFIVEKFKEDYSKFGWVIAGGIGNVTQAPVFWTLNGRWAYVENHIAILAFIFAFFSGCLITGLLARFIVIGIKKSMGESVSLFEMDIEDRKNLSEDPRDLSAHTLLPAKPPDAVNYNAIEVKDFSFRYYNQNYNILDNVSFNIKKGDFTLIFGPSGSGKSTLCLALSSLIPWSIRGWYKGDISIQNQSLKSILPNQLAGKVGLLMQNPDNQFINLIVKDEILFGAENLHISPKEIKKRYNEIIELLDLKNLEQRNVSQLSGGEKQRVILASILIMQPEILIMDEPFAYLDLKTRQEFLKYIIDIKEHHRKDLTIIIAEHRVSSLVKYANKCLEINQGKVNLIQDTEKLDIEFFFRYYSQNQNMNLDMLKNHYSKSITQKQLSYEQLLSEFNFQAFKSQNTRKTSVPVVEFENVSFYYQQNKGKYKSTMSQIIDNISFSIYQDEIVGIIGDNGIGKTTLLYLMAGILRPASGSIFYNGENISDIPYHEYARKIGLILQNPESQLLKSSIEAEIKFGPRNFNALDTLTKNRIDDLVDFVFHSQNEFIEKNIKDIPRNRFNPFKLSWGQKRRLNIASLYAYEPRIYLLDEPFTGQDFGVRTEIMSDLMSMLENGNIGVICSHDMEVLEFCNKVILMEADGIRIFLKKSKKPAGGRV